MQMSKGVAGHLKNRGGSRMRHSAIVKDNLSELLKPLWPRFPRIGCRGVGGDEKREASPLTEIAELVLKVLVEVEAKTKPVTLKELFVDHNADILQKIDTSVPPKARNSVRITIKNLRMYLGLKIGKKGRSLSFDQLPPKFRRQFEVFLKVAPKGIQSIPHLATLAERFEIIDLAPKSESSITLYKEKVLFGLGFIKWEGDVGVEDFLKVEPIIREYEGRQITENHNSLVDQYRFPERDQKTRRKAAGKDSSSFMTFLSGLKAIAACNGIFELHEEFNRAYKLRSDIDGRNARKDRQKEVMTRDWLDGEILLLKERFDDVIKTKSFKHSRRDLVLALFLPTLLVLRYLGYRQQCARNCDVGRHITFNRDGTVSFKWKAGEIKNKRPIDSVFSAKLHGGIKEIVLMLDVLNKYYRVVYRGYLMKRFRSTMGDAFFGYIVGDDGITEGTDSESDLLERDIIDGDLVVTRFIAERGQSDFCYIFKRYAYATMNFNNIELEGVSFHPHFLRAVCCDWMKYDLKMSWEEISKALGDTIRTLQSAYYKDEKIQSATDVFAEASKRLLAQSQAQEIGLPSAALIGLTEQIKILNEKLRSVGDQFKREKERNAMLESEGRLKDERLAAIMLQLLQNQSPSAFQAAAPS
jgi:hypothetical protein